MSLLNKRGTGEVPQIRIEAFVNEVVGEFYLQMRSIPILQAIAVATNTTNLSQQDDVLEALTYLASISNNPRLSADFIKWKELEILVQSLVANVNNQFPSKALFMENNRGQEFLRRHLVGEITNQEIMEVITLVLGELPETAVDTQKTVTSPLIPPTQPSRIQPLKAPPSGIKKLRDGANNVES